jgi:hypothetical protein
MNFAEGKGPKQVKTPYVLGQFVTLYGDGSVSNYNPATVPYPTQMNTLSGTVGVSGVVGGIVPGLNLNVNGNGATDISFASSPNPALGVVDLQSMKATVTAEAGWSGTSNVSVQGTMLRYVGTAVYSSTNWVTIGTGQVTTALVPVQITVTGTPVYNAYRIIASGGTGIIDWVLPDMFTDYSAMGVGSNAIDINGNIGQLAVQSPRNYTISGGQITTTVTGNDPLANTKANHNWIS